MGPQGARPRPGLGRTGQAPEGSTKLAVGGLRMVQVGGCDNEVCLRRDQVLFLGPGVGRTGDRSPRPRPPLHATTAPRCLVSDERRRRASHRLPNAVARRTTGPSLGGPLSPQSGG